MTGGARRRSHAQFAGYAAVAASAWATGWLAARYGLRPEPFYLGVGFVAAGLLLSAILVRETSRHAAHEASLAAGSERRAVLSQREIFWRTTNLTPTSIGMRRSSTSTHTIRISITATDTVLSVCKPRGKTGARELFPDLD